MGKSKRELITRGALFTALLAVGFGGGYLVRGGTFGAAPDTERQSHTMARLTSPFLECAGTVNADRRLVRVRAEVVRYIRQASARDTSLHVAVYARDLTNGPWIGIDERASLFLPASLWKLPLMIFTLAHAEVDPAILDRELVFPGPAQMKAEDSMLGAPEELRLQPGRGYAYKDLLFRMIAHSDNYAEELLMTGSSKADVDRLLQTINASDTYVGGQPYVDARTYASLFRVLYNATLLSRPMSEYALSFLAQSYLRTGLRKYIPAGVEVASKFGLHASPGDTQFHECGIVYHPRSPYTICIMTKSRTATPDQLAEMVASISRLVWEREDRP